MREITEHQVNECNAGLQIQALDQAGQGGAHHAYGIVWTRGLPGQSVEDRETQTIVLRFQNGPIREFGINGITEQALLAITIDRLRAFQAGPFASRENALALQMIQTGLFWLHERTRLRQARGVEGTNQK